jgi:hypothetical protein
MHPFVFFYQVIQVICFVAALFVFGMFFSKQEGISKGRALAIASGAVVVTVIVAAFIPLIFSGLMAFAAFYVADRKNRSRFLWAIPALLLGAPILLVLLLLPSGPEPTELTGLRI